MVRGKPLRVVETLESDLAKFESWAINGVGSEAALSALKISFFGDLNGIGVDKSEMHTFAKDFSLGDFRDWSR